MRIKNNNYLINKQQQNIQINNNDELKITKENTNKIQEEIYKEENEIKKIQNNIKKINKKINDKKTEIKSLKDAIQIIKNHSCKIHLKLEHLEKNNQEVLYNIGKIYLKEFKNYK